VEKAFKIIRRLSEGLYMKETGNWIKRHPESLI